jgi:hypothetical protein
MGRKTNSDLLSTGTALVDVDMYTVDQTLTAGQTITTNSNAIAVEGADSVDLYFRLTGANASSAGNVTFYVSRSYDGTNYESVGNTFLVAIATNTAVIGNAVNIDTRNARYIKIVKIINGDASYALSGVNVHAIALQ